MRASIVIAASLVGLIAGAACARAADLPVEPYGDGYGGYGVCCRAVYQPIPQVVIYDDEPGVVVRRWWLPPWRNRHYYPHGRTSLKRRSSVSRKRHRAARAELRPAPHYMHYWTNPQAGAAPLIEPDVALLPRPRPYAYRQSPPPAAAP